MWVYFTLFGLRHKGSITFTCQVCLLAFDATLAKLTLIFIGRLKLLFNCIMSRTLFFHHLSYGFSARVTLLSQLAEILASYNPNPTNGDKSDSSALPQITPMYLYVALTPCTKLRFIFRH
ncbi:hypothetical protein EV424DRAFT_610712 [Suillus variegatus]|nr:hypothetical protein EV424DRAFT_610712 [Suillus variegatus]